MYTYTLYFVYVYFVSGLQQHYRGLDKVRGQTHKHTHPLSHTILLLSERTHSLEINIPLDQFQCTQRSTPKDFSTAVTVNRVYCDCILSQQFCDICKT